MTNRTFPPYGWLGYLEEREAWEATRVMEELMLWEVNTDNGVQPQRYIYNEFDQYPKKELIARQKIYKNREFTWDLERRLHAQGLVPYSLIPTFFQDTGDCVAAALAGAGQKLQMLEIAIEGEEEKFREWFVPWIYALSRNQIGTGMRGAGSLSIWGARAANEYGILFSDDPNVPKYKGTSDEWGNIHNHGPIEKSEYWDFASFAKDNPIEVVRATSVEHMESLLDAGMQLTIASYQGFRVGEYRGLHVYNPSGRWSHVMHITDIRREPELMFYRMNQWGASHAVPLNGETPGGAWNFASDVDKELSKDTEVYGYSRFAGDDSGPRFDFV